MVTTVTLADEKRLLCAVAKDLSSYRRTAENDLAEWDERDAEILARTGPDPELAGLAEHAVEAIRARGGSRSLTEHEWQRFLAEYGPHMLPPDDES
jgi:hypothetical protein